MRRPRRGDDSGFTLLEAISVCLLLGILVGMAVGPWQSYRHARAHREARDEVVATLRNAQIASVAENITYRVDISGTTAISYRVPVAGTAVVKRRYVIEDPKIAFDRSPVHDSIGWHVGLRLLLPARLGRKGRRRRRPRRRHQDLHRLSGRTDSSCRFHGLVASWRRCADRPQTAASA